MPTFTQFWEWLNQGIYIIPTLGIQNGTHTVAAQKVLEIQSPQDRFFVIHAIETSGVIVVPNGNQDNFTVDQAQRTWDRFFGMLATSARSDGFHHSGGQIATPLPRLLAHQMSSAYILPPEDHKPSNLHFWFDCPNNATCIYVAAAVRVYLINHMQNGHILFTFL